MGVLTFFRVARRVVGLAPQPEFPNLETLFKVESEKPHNDYRVLSWVVPPIFAVLGTAALVMAVIQKTAWPIPLALIFWAAACGSWILCDRLDKSIPDSKQRIRKLCKAIWERYQRITSVVGVDPALSPIVAGVLDEAAGVYLKHTGNTHTSEAFDQSYDRAISALDVAMARMLDLAVPEAIRTQELELDAGWAMPLLQEMRQMDRALDKRHQTALVSEADPLAGLREARLELQGIDAAVTELEQNQKV